MINPTALSPALWLDPGYGATVGGARSLNGSTQTFRKAIVDSLKPGTGDFWVGAWVYAGSLAVTPNIASHWSSYSDTAYLSWALYFSAGAPTLVGYGGGTYPTVATSAVTANTWNFVLGWYDSTAQRMYVSLNAGTPASISAANPFPSISTGAFEVGARGLGAFGFLTGGVGPVAVGKLTSGIASVISDISSTLYAGGVGVWCSQISSAKKAAWGLVSYWDANETSGDMTDSHGTNHLTAYGTPGVADGPGTYSTVSDGDPIVSVAGMAGATAFSQSTAAKRPAFIAAKGNGRPAISFDGVDDWMQAETGISQPYVAFLVMYDRGGNNYFRSTQGNPDPVLYRPAATMNLFAGAAIGGTYNYNANAPVIATCVVNGASSSIRINGVGIGSGNAGTNNTRANFLLGAGGTATSPSAIDVQEFIVVASALSVSQIRGVEEYLAVKHRVTLTPPVKFDEGELQLLLR